MFLNRMTGCALVLLGIVLLFSSAYQSGYPKGRRVVYADMLILAERTTAKALLDPPDRDHWGAEFELPLSPVDSKKAYQIAVLGEHVVQLVDANNHVEGKTAFQVIPRSDAWLAAIGTALCLFALPYALFQTAGAKDASGHPISPWYYVLSDEKGYSLSRVQLLIWFFPAIIMYAVLSVPLGAFASLSTQFAFLLGLSGVTALLGIATSPTPKPGDVVPPTGVPRRSAAPALSDLVKGWDGGGEFSRYQYLALCLLGSTVMVTAFVKSFAIPVIPQEFLYLLGASQATFVGVKAAKQT